MNWEGSTIFATATAADADGFIIIFCACSFARRPVCALSTYFCQQSFFSSSSSFFSRVFLFVGCCFVSLRLAKCERRMCKRRFFSLLPILKSEILGYVYQWISRWPLLFFHLRQCFFLFLLPCMFAARDVIATRGHSCCQSTIRWVYKRLCVWIAIWWLTSFFSRLIFLRLSRPPCFSLCLFLFLSVDYHCHCSCNVLACRKKRKKRTKLNERIKAHTKRT